MRADEAARPGDQGLGHGADRTSRPGAAARGGLIRSEGLSTAIVTDSTCYLPEELVAANGIRRVSLYVTIEGEQRREHEIGAEGEESYDAFFERLRRSKRGAATSQPSVGDFLDVYVPLLAAGDEIVSIHISAGISGTCESARQARQQLIDEGRGGERIHVWDSRTGAGGQGMMALVAARAAARGADGEQVIGAIERARETLKMWFAVDTLEYLRKGGRIGAAQAWLGSALQIKPILTLEHQITPVERVRTGRRAFERLVEFARERHQAGAGAWVVQHIQDPERAGRLADECRRIFDSEPVFVSELGPVLGAHTGPGLLGFGGIETGLLKPGA